MKSSANQISPISRRREIRSRVANYLPTGWDPERLKDPFRTGRLRAEYAVNSGAYARCNAGMRGVSVPRSDAPLVALRTGRIGGLETGPTPIEPVLKSHVNAVLTGSRIFTENLPLGTMVWYFALRSDRRRGF
jgi:hypothetical protein